MDGVKEAYKQMARACKYLNYEDNKVDKNFFLENSRKNVDGITLSPKFKENIQKFLSNEINLEDIPQVFIILKDGPIKNTCKGDYCGFQVFYTKLIKKNCLKSNVDGSISINETRIKEIFDSEIKVSNTFLDNLLYDKIKKENILTTDYLRKFVNKNNLIIVKEDYPNYNTTFDREW